MGQGEVWKGRGVGGVLASSQATWEQCDTLFSSKPRKCFDLCMDNSFLINFKLHPRLCPPPSGASFLQPGLMIGVPVRESDPAVPGMCSARIIVLILQEKKLRCPSSQGKLFSELELGLRSPGFQLQVLSVAQVPCYNSL